MKAKKLDEILDLCDDFCPGEPPEYFFDRYDDYWCRVESLAMQLELTFDTLKCQVLRNNDPHYTHFTVEM